MHAIAQYLLFLAVLVALARPVGVYLVRVFERQEAPLGRHLGAVETALYRLVRLDPKRQMAWGEYALAFALFSVVGTALLYLILRLQDLLPGGPGAAYLTTPMTRDLAANTALSFATTTTWQAYGGETTLRYATQLVGLCAQNFLAGAAGLAVGFAFMRGFARTGAPELGNFWVDLVRAILYVLLPISLLLTPVLLWQGVPMSFDPYLQATTLEGTPQTIAQGPVAALEVIKNLGTNGGGFFNANAAHPYENPTPLTHFVEMLMILLVPVGMPYAFGRLTGRARTGWMLFGVMLAILTVGLALGHAAETAGNPRLHALGVTGGNLEGKEVRFGVGGSVLGAVVTSNGATGSCAATCDSFTPGGVLVMLFNLLLGEIAFGGLGTGLFGMVMVALLAAFVAGLLIGRTPEYAGKQLGPREMKLITMYTLVVPAVVLPLGALALSIGPGRAGLVTNGGAHGLSEILFAYASSAANNGMTMAGLAANTPFFNATTAMAMAAGRFALALLALALAGALARQGRRPIARGTLPDDTPLFALFVAATALIVGGLTYLPALVLGPIVEHFRLWPGG